MNTKGIDIADFKARTETEALARNIFYDDVDSGRMPHLARDWNLAPWQVREHYRSLAKRVDRIVIRRRPSPTVLAKAVLAARRLFHLSSVVEPVQTQEIQ